MAPVVALFINKLAESIDDPHALEATSIAAVALACACFGLVQFLLVQLRLTQMVKFLPYSIPMGFLSGIGLELCTGICLAGNVLSQAAAAVFAVALCLGSWGKGWPLSFLFPALLVTSISVFYLAGAPATWLLELEGGDSAGTGTAWSWSPETIQSVDWEVLSREGVKYFVVLFFLGCFQNILFAEVFARTPGLSQEVKPDQVLSEFGQAFFFSGLFGFTGGFHNMACFSLSRELKSYARAPSSIVTVLSCLLWLAGISPILRIPKFIFAGLLLWIGLKFLRTYLWQPALMLPRTETAVIVCVAGTMKVYGFATGVLAGLLLALVCMVGELATLSSVQVVTSGHEARSNAMRSVRAEQLLHARGHAVLVMRLAPGFVFFATSAQLVEIVERRLAVTVEPWQIHDPWIAGDSSDSEDVPGDEAAALSNVVIDFTLCRGFDGSLVGVLQQLASLGSRYKFKLCLAGLRSAQRQWINSQVASGAVDFFPDLDRALEFVEENLLSNAGLTYDKELFRPRLASASLAERLSSDAMILEVLSRADSRDSICSTPISGGWTLFFLYSDTSAASRSARPAVTQIMSLLQQHCDFFEAPEDSCPEFTRQCGPGPALALFHNGEPSWRIDAARMNSGHQAGAAGVALLPVAVEVAREIEQHIYSVEARNMMQTPKGGRTATSSKGIDSLLRDMKGVLDDSPSVRQQETQERTPKSKLLRRRRPSKIGLDEYLMDTHSVWHQFLELAGVPQRSILAGLASHVTGPRLLQPGEILLHKGSGQSSVYFVVSGLFSIWNEGRGHDQSAMAPASTGSQVVKRRDSSNHSFELSQLAQGTSRVLRVGPGWTIGGSLCQDLCLRPQLAPVTYSAETEACVLELPLQNVENLCDTEPRLALALQALVMHFNGQLLQHTASLLSDMNTLVFTQSS
eukprot:TRINITY_DN44109_c0_g1_i1.p1 TRINITY_DN44109_c0_g1~~TRINITY_DN44109_c0_g1_i1.p1  ORF type:complete len:950 (+),score=115.18 TRINITY_DN44109_c0_g1_i1:104-2851(+)